MVGLVRATVSIGSQSVLPVRHLRSASWRTLEADSSVVFCNSEPPRQSDLFGLLRKILQEPKLFFSRTVLSGMISWSGPDGVKHSLASRLLGCVLSARGLVVLFSEHENDLGYLTRLWLYT